MLIYLDDHRPGVHMYTPELGERKSETQMKARLSHDGRHYFVYTPLELKGTGIKESCFSRDGLRAYRVAPTAFAKLEKRYSIAMESPFD